MSGPSSQPRPSCLGGFQLPNHFTFYCVFCDVVTSMKDSFWAHLASCLNASQVPGLTPTCSRGCPLTEPVSSQGPLSHARYIAESTAMLFASHALRHVAGFVLNHGRKGLRERVMCPMLPLWAPFCPCPCCRAEEAFHWDSRACATQRKFSF